MMMTVAFLAACCGLVAAALDCGAMNTRPCLRCQLGEHGIAGGGFNLNTWSIPMWHRIIAAAEYAACVVMAMTAAAGVVWGCAAVFLWRQ